MFESTVAHYVTPNPFYMNIIGNLDCGRFATEEEILYSPYDPRCCIAPNSTLVNRLDVL